MFLSMPPNTMPWNGEMDRQLAWPASPLIPVFRRKRPLAPFWYHIGMAMTLRLPPEIEDQLKQVAEIERRSVQQTVLVAIEEYLSTRETAEILADPAALRGLAEARESEQAGDVVYGAEAARALLAERKR